MSRAKLRRAIESDRSHVAKTDLENDGAVSVRALKTYAKERTRKVWSVIGRVSDTASGFDMIRRLSTDPKWSGRPLAVFVGRKRVEEPPAPPATPTPMSPIAPTIVAETLRECREVVDGLRARTTSEQSASLLANAVAEIQRAEKSVMAAFGITRK